MSASEMTRRVAAVHATRARFEGHAFALGRVDCVKVAAWHLRGMGHRIVGFGKAGAYSTTLGARRALRRAGHASLEAAIDAVPGLLSIAPAATLPGDLVLQPGSGGIEAIGIVMDAGVVLGFHEDGDAGLQPIRIGRTAPTRAWRV